MKAFVGKSINPQLYDSCYRYVWGESSGKGGPYDEMNALFDRSVTQPSFHSRFATWLEILSRGSCRGRAGLRHLASRYRRMGWVRFYSHEWGSDVAPVLPPLQLIGCRCCIMKGFGDSIDSWCCPCAPAAQNAWPLPHFALRSLALVISYARQRHSVLSLSCLTRRT